MERPSPPEGDAAPVSPPATEAPRARAAIPSNFGKYEIIFHLASGGMADIFLSRARGIQGFEKLAIIKRVREDRALDKKMVDLFLDEARLAASLQHPNIVQVFEFGIAEGSYFLAMEYVHGEDAHHLVNRMRMNGQTIPLGEVLAIITGVCQGLHYAHECVGANGQPLGIVHRDISPSNVLVSYDGAVMITDFGIAMATGRSSRTTTGTVRGKLAYMSPEQCRGLPLDRRSDIFALGTLLHELSTGAPLFSGLADFDVMKGIVEDPIPPPSQKVAEYPQELERIVMKALARNPANRYATARELQLDIERFAVDNRLAISSARLAGFMQTTFADRIAAWRERVSLDHAARAASGRVPSAEVEIIAATGSSTQLDAPLVVPRRRGRVAIVAGLAAAAAVVAVVGQRQLATSHAQAVATPGVSAPAHAATPAVASPPIAPSPVAPPPIAASSVAPIAPQPAAQEPVAAARESRAAVARSTHAPAAPIRHRHTTHRQPARATTSTTEHAAPHAKPDWNPEDGLPPSTAH